MQKRALVSVCCAAAFLLCGASAFAQNAAALFFKNLEYSAQGSILFFPESNGNSSAAMPILPSLGASVSHSFNRLVALEISLDIYMNYYDYNYNLDRVVPADIEDRTSIIFGFITGFQPVFRFRPKNKFVIRAYGGLALDLRACLLAPGLDKGESHGEDGHTLAEAAEDVFAYLWGGGRFVFPVVGYGMDFPLIEGMKLGFDIRAWFPLWRGWTNEKDLGMEGFRFGVGFRVTFK
jgi:hypothetical protein